MGKSLKGGSLASNYVMGLLKKRCKSRHSYKTNKESSNLNSVRLYKVTSGGAR